MHPLHLTSVWAPFAVSSASATLANLLISSIWQGLVLTVAVALSLKLLPGLSAAARSAIWTAVLVLILALPLIPFVLPHSAPPSAGLVHAETSISLALVALWAAASLFRLAQLGYSAFRLIGILRRAQPLGATGAVLDALHAGKRRVILCSSEDVDRPSVAGFFHPRILFPSDLLAELNETELAQIVIHESEHLRRYDDWINLLQQICLVLLPLNPAVLWLNRRLSLERELACDDSVLATTRARKAYAACLARVAENTLIRRSAALVLGVLGTWTRKPDLASRVERILSAPATRMPRTHMRFATGAVLAGVIGAGGILAHSPRLVSFGPAATTPVMAQTEPEPVPAAPVSSMGALRPTLAKAIMPPTNRGLRQALAPNLAPAHRLVIIRHRRVALTPRRVPSEPWVLKTSWRQPVEPLLTPEVHMTTVVFEEDSQTWLTAVAVRDGWIIVQL